MNSKDLHGLTVISSADGSAVGALGQVYLDLAAKQDEHVRNTCRQSTENAR